MTNLHKVAVIGLIALTASTSFASAFPVGAIDLPIWLPPNGAPPASHGTMSLDCRVKGSDFWIMNFGTKAIDSGRQVAWRSPISGDEGVLSLPGTLQPGEEVRLADVLTDDVAPGSPCAAVLV